VAKKREEKINHLICGQDPNNACKLNVN